MDDVRITQAKPGDPFYAAKLSPRPEVAPDHPHACIDGWVYLGELVEDPETGGELEVYTAIPCRRCSEL